MTVVDNIGQGNARISRAVPDSGDPLAGNANMASLVGQWLQILSKWRWVIIGSIAIAAIAAVIITLLMTRMYTAEVSLEISREQENIVNIQGVEPQVGMLDQEFYQTQYGLLQSRSLAEHVAKDLDLMDNRAFFAMYGESRPAGIPTGSGALPAEGARKRMRVAVDALLDHLTVSPTRASRLVTIGFASPDPDFSAKVANTWADDFIKSNLERRYDATNYARNFLQDHLEETRIKLEKSERELVAYATQNNIIALPSSSSSGQDTQSASQDRSVVTDELLALNQQLAQARAHRIQAESRYRNQGLQGASAEALTNPALATLRQRRAEAAAEYTRLMAQFNPQYPPAQAVAGQIKTYDQAIANEEARVNSSIASDYHAALADENKLAASVKGLENQVLKQRGLGIQYNIYQREVDTNRQLYNALLQRYKEVGIAGGVGANNVSVVDRAIPPEKPSRPRPLINLLVALLAGAAVGMALAFILDQIDEAFSDTAQIERELGLPMLGVVPKLAAEDPLAEIEDRKSELSEAYLSVETGLRFSTPEGLPRSLVITSTQPSEGKSTTALALALTVARLGHRTLLVDADMRSPSVHSLLGLVPGQGLSDVLTGHASLSSIVRDSGKENLKIVLAGHTPPNAAELLSGLHLEEFVRDALDKFDIVIFDAPPVMGLADAPLLASKVTGCAMVVEANRTRSRQAKVALRRLENVHANIIGAVLTKFDAKRAHYGYGYDYGYGYGVKDKVDTVVTKA